MDIHIYIYIYIICIYLILYFFSPIYLQPHQLKHWRIIFHGTAICNWKKTVFLIFVGLPITFFEHFLALEWSSWWRRILLPVFLYSLFFKCYPLNVIFFRQKTHRGFLGGACVPYTLATCTVWVCEALELRQVDVFVDAGVIWRV